MALSGLWEFHERLAFRPRGRANEARLGTDEAKVQERSVVLRSPLSTSG